MIKKPRIPASAPSLFDDFEMRDYALPRSVELRFISFGSGSSGNCAYLGTRSEGFLIDAGVSPDLIKDELRRRGIAMSSVKGIVLTHDHSDHIRFTYKILKKHPHIALYSTPKTLSGIFRRHSLSPRLKDYHRAIYIETPFKIGSFTLTAFQTLHDGTDNVGYFIENGDKKFAIATDLGQISERVDFYMRQANYIVMESNYDAQMLANGPYPMHLKARIASETGHLDNLVTARYLASIFTPELSHIFLCHLSDHNNTPEIALAETRNALEAAGLTVGDASGSYDQISASVQLYALPRQEPSQFFVLR